MATQRITTEQKLGLPADRWYMRVPVVVWPLALYLIGVAVEVLWSYRLAAHHFVYPLDDTYIHMAIARNFALHGVWGVTKFGFTSSSSSLLFDLLLAAVYLVTGPKVWVPLALAVLAVSGTRLRYSQRAFLPHLPPQTLYFPSHGS